MRKFWPSFGGSRGELVERAAHEAREGRQLAIFDPATGVLAEWYFRLRLKEETRRCGRYDLSLAVVTLALAQAQGGQGPSMSPDRLTQVVANSARASDIVGRLDLNLVGVCLLHTKEIGAFSLLQRMMSGVEAAPCNVGLAMFPNDEGSDLIEVALRRAAPWARQDAGRAEAA